MATFEFDLGVFRDLAFGRRQLPDHPMQDEAEAKKLLAPGEILLAPGQATRGTQYGVPLASGEQRIRVARVIEDNEHFQRAKFESLGVGL